jgi:hypothetical protein
MEDKNILINNFYNYDGDKRTLINNAIEPELGLHIFEMAFKKPQLTLQLNTKELVSIPPNPKGIGYP